MAQAQAQTITQTAQDLYRQELMERATDLWQTYSASYRGKLPRYHELLEKKRELGIRPLHAINAQILEQFPDIPLLKIPSEDELREYLEKLAPRDLQATVVYAEWAIESDGVYRLVCNCIVSFSYEVQAFGHKIDRNSALTVSPTRAASGLSSGKSCRRLSDEYVYA